MFGCLLMAFGAGMTKSNARIQYERDLERHRPEPRMPSPTGANILLGVSLAAAVVGLVMIVSAVRDTTRQIGEVRSKVETQMRLEVSVKRDPKTKP
jgi:hypothetical protein